MPKTISLSNEEYDYETVREAVHTAMPMSLIMPDARFVLFYVKYLLKAPK